MANKRTKRKPYREASRKRHRLTISAIIVSTIYLVVRLTTLGNGWFLLLSIPLLMAEIQAFGQLLLLTFQAWRIAGRMPTGAPSLIPVVDIMVDASRSDASMLERSLVGASIVESGATIRVVDSSPRPEIAAKAEEFGASYTADTRLEHGAAQVLYELAETEMYVWLEAGQVPMPDLVTRNSARFTNPLVAVCQGAVGLLNADSLVHIQRGRDEDALQRDVLWPGLDRLGAAPWFGPASIIRRAAIESIGGFPIGVATVERALVMLHSNGWTSSYESEQLVRTVAPDTLDEYLEQRKGRSIDALGVFFTPQNPIRVRSLSRPQRWAHLAMASAFGSGLRQLVVTAVLVVTLLTGRLPFEASLVPLVVLWATSTCLGMLARLELARGSMKIGDWTRLGWRTLGADFAGLFAIMGWRGPAESWLHHARTGLRTLGRLRLLTLTVIGLDVALLIRAATLFGEGPLPAFSTAERIVVIAFGLIMLVPMVDVLQLVVTRRQRRKSFRLQVGLDVELGDLAAQTVDVATSGVGVLMEYSPAVGTTTAIRLKLPMVDGTPRWISGTAVVRAANPDPSGLVRVGLEFANLTDDARIALVEYCIIGHAANKARLRGPAEISEDDRFLIPREDQDHRSLRVLTGVASFAAVMTLAMGPAVSASELVFIPIDQVCVVRVDGAPVAGTTIDLRTDSGWEVLNETGESGCVEVESLETSSEFAATEEAVRLETSPAVDEAGSVTFVMQRHAIRLLTTEGTGVNGASVRYFTNTWHEAGDTDPAGVAYFDTLTPAVEVEVTWKGSRTVLPLVPGGLDVVLGRVDAGGLDVAAIDRGEGWEPFHDHIQVMHGRIVVRLADGSTIKTEVEAGHALDLLTGTQTLVTSAAIASPEEQ